MAIAIKKLDRVYRLKKGVDVHALKSISFNLPDRGMVFILGKSGCGKSTLLNLLGGLDGFDGGDIVVDGKSLKGYKAKDLDGYRNDYVGFVFQENNLIEKMSARRNISLALELQSENDVRGRVESVLESVGLKGFAERKCNSMSGGQKQRVAIARALIKHPKLILCDEPTGALDSETGEEIFTLLKELSKDRLVVVVSHDRESAEKYGDRVIELKDGEIISDSAPYEIPEQAQEKPAEKKHGSLSFKRAFTMGAGYIIAKPVRMVICLFICLITFVLVGVMDSFDAFSRDKALYYTMEERGNIIYEFSKVSINENMEYLVNISGMSEREMEELRTLLDVDRTDIIYMLGSNWGGQQLDIEGFTNKNNMFDNARVTGYIETDEKLLSDYNYKLLEGRLPETTSEIVLPEFLFNFFKAHGYRDNENGIFYSINSYEDLINKNINMFNQFGGVSPYVTVTGIIDTFFNYEKQSDVLFNGAPYYDNFGKDLNDISYDTIHNTIFVCKGFYSYFCEKFGYESYEKDRIVSRVIAPYTGSKDQKLKNLRVYTTQYNGKPVEAGGKCYHLVNHCASAIANAEDIFERFHKYAQYIAPVMILISVLFLLFYASGTIGDKRKEIGILRATGASRADITKIIACEHGTFTFAAVVLSSVIGAIAVAVINGSFTKSKGIATIFIRFGIRQLAVVAAVAILAVVAGVAAPLIKLLIKKPVDVISDRK